MEGLVKKTFKMLQKHSVDLSNLCKLFFSGTALGGGVRGVPCGGVRGGDDGRVIPCGGAITGGGRAVPAAGGGAVGAHGCSFSFVTDFFLLVLGSGPGGDLFVTDFLRLTSRRPRLQ